MYTLFLESVNSILAANLISMCGGGAVCVLVSWIETLDNDAVDDPDSVWQDTLEIDNPLRPWAEIYVGFAVLSL